MDPQANADYAAGMISNLLKRYGGDLHKALSAYNSGSPDASGTKTDWQDGRRLGYADSVLRHYAALGGTTPAAILADSSAESQQEQSSVNALSSFAALQLSAPQLPTPSSDHSWRSMQKQTTGFASIIFAGDDSSE
jgi:transglycosylase-like protein with SLT domain